MGTESSEIVSVSQESIARATTAGQVIDIGTEIMRHCSPALAGLTKEEAKKLHDNPVWLDMWAIAALRLRLHGLLVGVDPSEQKLAWIVHRFNDATAKNWGLRKRITWVAGLGCESLLMVSDSRMLPRQRSDDHPCFYLLVEEKPTNTALLSPPSVFWVKPSDCPGAIVPVLSRLLAMR